MNDMDIVSDISLLIITIIVSLYLLCITLHHGSYIFVIMNMIYIYISIKLIVLILQSIK